MVVRFALGEAIAKIDGAILAVVFVVPGLPGANTVALLFGSSSRAAIASRLR